MAKELAMPKPLSVHSETRLAFEIRYGEVEYLLRLDGGAWLLTSYPNFHRNLSNYRLTWNAALARALGIIEAQRAQVGE